MVFSICVFLLEGENELECDKDYFGIHWTHDDESRLHVILIRNRVKDLEMDLEIYPTLVPLPPITIPSSLGNNINYHCVSNMHPARRLVWYYGEIKSGFSTQYA